LSRLDELISPRPTKPPPLLAVGFKGLVAPAVEAAVADGEEGLAYLIDGLLQAGDVLRLRLGAGLGMGLQVFSNLLAAR
jgi:hypothetical protein